ncbi:hypothetical protein FHQ28_05345 [Pasteurellaceae bacterium USgator11]|nr:hypothetical protein FHQ19_09455 [Pasteurellaceae bacterium UScroc12]TNG94740.1 hypothetical protein FHQ20_08085 [Pasteurellaceae bacterium USgator41]TNG97711.1 hypothetical protein FHQ24_09875 [Pasteurellaceae bacterium UScroc31]TNH01672.1 hypothetical protein FHQ28_05345 [Pasteurellaceae bacterium USgator11]
MTKGEVLAVLKKHKFSFVHNKALMIWSTKGNTIFVCTFESDNPLISISFNRAPDLDKATKVMRKLFGDRFTHLKSHPMDSINANYFRLETVN